MKTMEKILLTSVTFERYKGKKVILSSYNRRKKAWQKETCIMKEIEDKKMLGEKWLRVKHISGDFLDIAETRYSDGLQTYGSKRNVYIEIA